MTVSLLADRKGYYALLGVTENAGYSEIKRAYRRLARRYHPDRNSSAFAEDMIKRINAAFETLSDESRRMDYDKERYDSGSEDSEGAWDKIAKDDLDNNEIPGQSKNEQTETPGPSREKIGGHRHSSHTIPIGRKSHAEYVRIGPQFPDIPKGRFHIIVEPSLCMAFGSCETLAPKVFVVEKNKRINPKARVESETGAPFESILAAAETCPTKAIKIIDRYTGEQIFP